MSALDGGEWELFDLSKDRTEFKNIKDLFPEKVEEMNVLWEEWAGRMNISGRLSQ